MVKTRKVISLVLVVAMVLTVLAVGIVSASAAQVYCLTGTVANPQWKADRSLALTENGDEYVIENVALTTSDMVKVVLSAKSEENNEPAQWFPDGMDNNVTVAEDGIYTIHFRPNGDGSEADGWIYIPYEGDASGLDAHGATVGGYMFKVEKTGEYTPEETVPAEVTEPAEIDTITITVKDEAGYGAVKAHYWGGEATSTWPGDDMIDNGDGTFTLAVPAGTTGLVFNNGDGTQTENVESGIADGAVFTITADVDEAGHNLVNVGEPEETTPEETTPEETTPEETTPEETTPAEGGDGKVVVDGATYDAHVDDIIHYEFYINMADLPADENGKKGYINQVEGQIAYDKDKLELLTEVEGKSEEVIPGVSITRFAVLPNIVGGNIVVNNDSEFLKYNASDIATGYKFDSEKVLVKADFKVKQAGSSEIVNTIQSLGSGEFRMIEAGVAKETPVTKTVVEVECNHTPEETTPEETTPEETTPEETTPEETTPEETTPEETTPAGGQSTITVVDWNGETETKVVEVGDEITVTSYLKVPEGKKVNSINFWQEFNIDADMVELISDVDDDEDEMFPNLSGLTANVDGNIIKANHTVAKYKQAFAFDSEESIMIQTKYRVVAEGNSKIKTDIITLATISEDQSTATQISTSEKVGEDEIFTKTTLEAPDHTPEETTPEETTPEETTPEETTPEETTPEETTPEETTPEETTPEETTPEETTPEETTPEETTPEVFDGVMIIADGTKYAVKQGDTFTYTYYMTAPEKIHSLDANTVYGADGLELKTDIDDAFPILELDATSNEEPKGTILYNYSHAKKGKDFTAEDSILIQVDFLVTAESGTYYIDTTIVTLAGPDEHQFIYDGEEVDEGVTTVTKLTDEDGIEIPPYTGPEPGTTPEETTPEETTPEETTPEETTPEETTPEETTPEETTPEPGSEPEPASGTSTVEPGEDNPGGGTSPKTGSTEIALIFLMVLVLSAGVVVFVKKKRFN